MSEVSQEVVRISEQYLGFAARRYLDRQCRLHMEKQLDELTPEDIDKLALWVKNTAPLIMDADESDKLAEEIYALRKEFE